MPTGPSVHACLRADLHSRVECEIKSGKSESRSQVHFLQSECGLDKLPVTAGGGILW